MRYPSRHSRHFGGLTLAVVATIAATVFLTESSPLAYASGSAAAPAATRVALTATHSASLASFAAGKSSATKAATPKPTPKAAVKKKAAVAPYKVGTKKYNLWFARTYMKAKYKWNSTQFVCLTKMWVRESGWSQFAYNRSGAQGIPQAMPGKKMAKFGKDWRTNPVTQIKWGLDYIKHVYNSPCSAWNFWQNHQWY
jgi:hypothetical protein